MLEGLKIVEFATYVAAPSAAAVMSDWGADVIKVESGRGDPTRRTFAGQPHLEGNPVFEFENHGKRGVVLDIAKPAGRDALLAILKDADVFLTNVRPAALKRAKLDYDNLKDILPALIYVSVTGYGLQGEGADLPAFDLAAFWSHGGVSGALTPKGHEPQLSRPAMGDAACALATVSATLAAVIERQATGRGRLVETSLIRTGVYSIGWDMAIQLKWGRLASQRTRKDVFNAIQNYFKTKDDRWVGVFPRDGRDDFDHILKALEMEHLTSDARFADSRSRAKNVAALVEALDEGFARLTLDEIGARLDGGRHGVGTAELSARHGRRSAGGSRRLLHRHHRRRRRGVPPARLPGTFPGADDGPKRQRRSSASTPGEVLSAAGFPKRRSRR